MELLYCPICLEYLEGSNGELQDCTCGWKQPKEIEDEDEKEYSTYKTD